MFKKQELRQDTVERLTDQKKTLTPCPKLSGTQETSCLMPLTFLSGFRLDIVIITPHKCWQFRKKHLQSAQEISLEFFMAKSMISEQTLTNGALPSPKIL